MVNSKSIPSSGTVAPVPSNSVQVSGSPSDEEMVAITAAVNQYIAIDDQLYMQSSDKADKSSSLSPWLAAGRLEASKSAQAANKSLKPAVKARLWGSLFSLALIAAGLGLWAPQAVAQGKALAASNKAAAFYGTWNYKDDGQTVRVLLGAPTHKVDLELPDGGNIYAADGTLVAKVGPRSSWSLNLASAPVKRQRFVFAGKGALDIATTKALAGSGAIQNTAFVPNMNTPPENRFALSGEGGYLVVPNAQSTENAAPLVGINGKLYRGSLLLRPSVTASGSGEEKSLTTLIAVINIVKIEDYLLSVVPSEVPTSWHQEVLKAQAIAARSYVVANLGKHKANGYDVKDSVEDQVYRGVISENNDTNVACANTAGLVLKQNAQVISAFFHSTSGGSTELAENVWGKPLPYLKSVVDFDDAAPLFAWQRSFTIAQLNKLLSLSDVAAGEGSAAEQLTGIFIVGRHSAGSQRVKHLIAVGTTSGRVLTGAEVRKLLNLPSTQFSVYQSDGAYVFSGRGNGHGLGLSQWGAKALADKGYNAGQILSYYYKDVTIESMGEPTGANGSI